eukprot:Protomagalhaensia_wolfi_Nauph_80__2301@NODE_2500_length_1074_cov_2_832850_g1959_i0_p1_GENE_NODE_2500_length_1074_cov_2_832850_g1959_i0NODE_2500_length_1074_cov_2_832850_g1959_i0_p1_ORF_typecomplete_len215_score15_81_NODE_2500_length_1074_cov_2_832850_g1959_i0219863
MNKRGRFWKAITTPSSVPRLRSPAVWPVLPVLPKVRRRLSRHSGPDETKLRGEAEPHKAKKPGQGIHVARRADSLPLLHNLEPTDPSIVTDWREKRAYSLQADDGKGLTLLSLLQSVCDETFEAALDYEIAGSTSWRPAQAKVSGFELTVKDMRKELHHIGLSIVIDLAAADTQLTHKDEFHGVFHLQTRRGSTTVRPLGGFDSKKAACGAQDQ